MKEIIIFLVLLLVSGPLILGQNRIYRKYGTQVNMMRLISADNSFNKELKKMEKLIDENNFRNSKQSFIVPIVFHILGSKNTGPDNIQINKQLRILNNSFNDIIISSLKKHPAMIKEKFEEKIANPNITFCIAAPDNKFTKSNSSINRKNTQKLIWDIQDSMKYTLAGGEDAWDPKSYLNIWIVALGGGYAGYAQMPGGPANTDGVVIDIKYFSSSADQPKYYQGGLTLVHLIANYLGVYDLWNETKYCADDNVDDTPVHNGQNFGIINDYGLVSTCDGQPIAMNMNYMDNSDDGQTFMFTNGQKSRMLTVLSLIQLRGGLVKSKKSICESNIFSLNIESRNISEAENFKIYPNPTANNFTLKYSNVSGLFDIVAYAIDGKITMNKVINDSVPDGILTLETNTWTSGTYMLLIRTKDKRYSRKLIVTK